jgi:hypothetical protein
LFEAGSTVVPGAGTALVGPNHAWADYLAVHDKVVAAENGGQFSDAVALATGSGSGDELPAEAALSQALTQGIGQAQTVFEAKAAAGDHDLARLSLGLFVLVIVAAALALIGLEQRISEYR